MRRPTAAARRDRRCAPTAAADRDVDAANSCIQAAADQGGDCAGERRQPLILDLDDVGDGAVDDHADAAFHLGRQRGHLAPAGRPRLAAPVDHQHIPRPELVDRRSGQREVALRQLERGRGADH